MSERIISLKSPNLILAGIGALQRMGDEITGMGIKKALIVTDQGVIDAGICEQVQKVLTSKAVSVDVFSRVIPDPDIACCEDCIGQAKLEKYDLMVGLGGGSSMDICSITSIMCTNPGAIHDYFGINLVKNPGIPTFLIPTTAGTGAEVTPNAILTDTGSKLKKGIVSSYILPRAAIIDPRLTLSMPPRVTAFTGMDALTHAIEAYTSVNATPLTDIYAREAIRIIGQNLRTAVVKGDNVQARYGMSIGSLYAGIALANAGVGAVHALAYPLGGEFNVPHGIANGLLLPHVMELNVPGDIPKFAEVALLMGEKADALSPMDQARLSVKAVKDLLRDLPMPKTLSELKIPREAVPNMAAAAQQITRLMANNPRNLTVNDSQRIFEMAF